MPVWRVDFRIAHTPIGLEQRLHDLAAALGRKAPVGGEGRDEKRCTRALEHLRQIACGLAGRIEIVERPGDQEIGIGVEIARELLALIAKVGFDLKLDIERESVITRACTICAFAQSPTKLFAH